MLILSEDSGGATRYLKQRLKGTESFRVKIRPGVKPDPKNLIAEARSIVQDRDEADVVVLIFDRDHRHSSFKTVLSACNRDDRLYGIGSAPSIEYWFLLHLEDCAPVLDSAKKMIAKLKSNAAFSEYHKSDFDVWRALEEHGSEANAISRAVAQRNILLTSGGELPFTDVDKICALVDTLAATNGNLKKFLKLKDEIK